MPKTQKISVELKHFPIKTTEKVYLAISNEYWNGEIFVIDKNKPLTVVKLSEYSSWCTNSFPQIYRVSFSASRLKKWVRSYNHHALSGEIDV